MKKKLLIAMPALSRGGGERVVSELSQAFAEHLDLVIAVFEQKESYPYRARIVDMGVPLSESPFARALLFFRRLQRFKKVINQERPDRVMTLGLPINLMAVLLAKDPVVRVDMFLSVARKGFLGWAVKLLAKMMLRRAGLVAPVSRAIALDLERHYGVPTSKLRTIYNPVDVAAIKRKAEEEIAPQYRELFSHSVVVTMGRLTEQKGQWHLLRAFREIHRQVPDARLALLGEGELRGRLERLAQDLGVADSVHFLGWQENPFAYLSRAQLFVLPSLWEGLPDVLLEALACGLPSISTDCRSGPREILAPSTYPLLQAKDVEHGEYGVLLPVCDGKWRDAKIQLSQEERMMADTVAGVLRDEGALLRLKEKAGERARSFDSNAILPRWSFLWS